MKVQLQILLYLLFFFIGIEYVLILPSLNDYLAVLKVGSSYLGICIGSLNFAALVTNIPFGTLADKTGNIRLVGTCLALCAAVGNVFYVTFPSIYAVVTSRIFSGIGSSIEPILYGVLGTATTTNERSTVIAKHMLVREMGLIFGPMLNTFFENIDIPITETIVLNKFTMPAAFLATAWSMLAISLLVWYEKPKPISQSNSNPNNNIVRDEDGFNVEGNLVASESLLTPGHSDRHPTLTSSVVRRGNIENPFTSLTTSQFNFASRSSERVESTKTAVEENIGWQFLLTDAFVVVMMSSFSVMFFESSLETILTPITKKFFNWGSQENSMCYVAIGLSALSGYFVLMLLQKFVKMEDRTLLLLGSCGVTISLSTVIVTWPHGYYGTSWLLPSFAVQIGSGVFFLPFLLVPPATLLSKLAPLDKQSTLQAARMSFQKSAMVLGPLWGANTLFNLYYCIAAPLFMVSLVMALTSSSFTYLSDEKIKYKSSHL